MLPRLLLFLVCFLACKEPAPKPDPQTQAWSERYQTGRAAFGKSRFAAAQEAFAQAEAAVGVLGLLTEALRRRHEAGLAPFTVLVLYSARARLPLRRARCGQRLPGFHQDATSSLARTCKFCHTMRSVERFGWPRV